MSPSRPIPVVRLLGFRLSKAAATQTGRSKNRRHSEKHTMDNRFRFGNCKAILTIAFLTVFVSAATFAQNPATHAGNVVSFSNEELTLGGWLYKPEGDGPFPGLLYNHGSAPGMLNNHAFERIGPLFVNRGWVFFAPYRRGQGLSDSAGPFIGDEISRAQKKSVRSVLPLTGLVCIALVILLLSLTRNRKRWLRVSSIFAVVIAGTAVSYTAYANAGATAMVGLLETEHLDDHLASLDWLMAQPFVDQKRVATGGNSFGGVVTVLGTERVRYCAAFDAAGGSRSWSRSPQLRSRMIQAARNSQTPTLFFQAANDYTIAPSKTLSNEMLAQGTTAELRVYPAFGNSSAAGHSFAWKGATIWADDVINFLEKHCY